MPSPNLQRDNYFNVISDTYDEKEFRGEYSGSNLIYAGFAIVGSDEADRVWQIKKLEYSGANLISVKWPELNSRPSIGYDFA